MATGVARGREEHETGTQNRGRRSDSTRPSSLSNERKSGGRGLVEVTNIVEDIDSTPCDDFGQQEFELAYISDSRNAR